MKKNKIIILLISITSFFCSFYLNAQDDDIYFTKESKSQSSLEAKKEYIFGAFGFKLFPKLRDYQQYIGNTIKYLPCIPIDPEEQEIFNTHALTPDSEYIIKSISPKNGVLKQNNTKLTICLQEKNGNKEFKIKTNANLAYKFPFIFIDYFHDLVPSIIGNSYSDPELPGEYKLTDVRIETPKSGNRKTVQYYFENAILGDTFITDKLSSIHLYMDVLKEGKWDVSLVKVEKPEDMSDSYSDIKTIQDEGVTKYSFEDELIDMMIFDKVTEFSFTLKNKSQNSIRIIWDDAVYVDENNRTSKIMHSGIKYNDREASQPASTIIRSASLSDIAMPTSNVYFNESLKKWDQYMLYPKTKSSTPRQVRLMLPIKVKDVVNEYVFVFEMKYKFKYSEIFNIE